MRNISGTSVSTTAPTIGPAIEANPPTTMKTSMFTEYSKVNTSGLI